MLQWGRRVHSAKSGGIVWTEHVPFGELQWGRRVHSAKRRPNAPRGLRDCPASMGSPSSLGEELDNILRHLNEVELQWGRRVHSAKRPPLADGLLQWGRRVHSAKSSTALAHLVLVEALQWG